MGYYQGDYRGDYYRGTAGDPFLGGLFGKIFKVGKSLLGFGGGTSTSAITKAVETGIQRSFPGVGTILEKAGGKAIGIAKAHPVLTGAGAAGVIGALGAGAGHLLTAHGVAPKGFHVSRKTGKVVRNRRMNACNGRALHRALRRAHAFERLARRVIGFSSPRRPKGHMYFRRKRSKK